MDQAARLQAALGQRYAFDGEVGHGMTTIVYRARDLKHDRLVAIKVLDPETTAGLGTSRFLREIQIVARLQHPHILPLFDSGHADGFLYYVMPLVEGESLRDRLTRDTQLPLADALRITAQVAEALGHAHSHGVIHRDIKPGNILLTGGHAVVSDFGIARALDVAAPEGVTSTGLTVGTPAYMSPEQCTGSAHLDARSDIYSLGCVLYEMLAGEPPFPGPDRRAVMARHVQEKPPSPRVFRPHTPEAVESIVAKALAKLPADRYQSPEELGEALTVLSSGPPLTEAPRGPRWTTSALLAVAILLALWVGVAVLNPSSSPTVVGGGLVVLPLEGPRGDGEAATLHRLMQNALSFLPNLQVIDGTDLLEAGGSGWRSHDMRELLQGAADKGGAHLLVGGVLDGSEGRTLAVDGYSVESDERLFHLEEGPVPTRIDDAVDRLALSVARELAGMGVDVGVPPYLFRSTVSARALGHLLQGQKRFYQRDLDGAKTAFDRAIQTDPTFALAYHRRSIVDVWNYDYPAALSSVDLGVSHAASTTREWRDLLRAQRLLVTRQADSLVDLMERYVSDFPDNADGWFILGEANEAFSAVTGGCASDAIPSWRRSLQIDDRLAPVHRDIVQLALRDGNEELARAHLEEIPEADRFPRAAFDLQFGDASVRGDAPGAETRRACRDLGAGHASRLRRPRSATGRHSGLDPPGAPTLQHGSTERRVLPPGGQRRAGSAGRSAGHLEPAPQWRRIRLGDRGRLSGRLSGRSLRAPHVRGRPRASAFG